MNRYKAIFLETYQYREVLLNILVQDLKIKYQRTYFGYFWSLLNPLFQLLVLSVIFSHITRIEMQHYTLYLFSGLLPWAFFNQTCALCTRAFLENENFIKKVYLPKFIFPLSKVGLRGVDFLFALISLSFIGLIFGFSLPSTFIYLPMAIAPLFFFTLGLGIIASVLTVYLRDWEYIQNVLLNVLYFATPILYPVTALPENYQTVLKLNPVYTQIQLFQELLYHGRFPSEIIWTQAWTVSLVFFGLGLITLKNYEEDLVYRL